jgi:hypothetical protein
MRNEASQEEAGGREKRLCEHLITLFSFSFPD